MNVAYAPTQTLPPMEVIILPANKDLVKKEKKKGRLKVCAYCRVSTDDEEQLTSYEAQIGYYTEKIQSNPEWQFVEVFADEGISGVMTKKRDDFNRMIEMCREGKIDRILTKSISRFARNLVDSIKYIRELKSLGVSVYFEKENIDTGEMTSEMMVALYSVFAQAESESHSNNIKLGKRFGFKLGRVPMMYNNLMGYRKGTDGEPEIVPEEAEIIRLIFRKFLDGMSYGAIAKYLKAQGIKTKKGKTDWSTSVIMNILTNEKFKGDVLVQKTYIVDLFTKKSARNTGELPMYYIKNHHIPIIEPAVYDMVQVELARRNSLKSTSDKNTTMKSKYSSKYALTGLVVCGDCGAKYRRITWARNGTKKIVWRCTSRIDYGKKYCTKSVTIEEDRLHSAIVSAMNSLLDNSEKIKALIHGSIAEILTAPDTEKQILGLTSSIKMKNAEIVDIIREGVEKREDRAIISERCKEKHDEVSKLQAKLNAATAKQQMENLQTGQLREIYDAINRIPGKFTEYDDEVARMMISKVKILTEERAEITMFNAVNLTVNI